MAAFPLSTLVSAPPPAVANYESPKQLKQLPKGRESPEWISSEEWRILVDQNPDDGLTRSSSVVSIFRVPNFLKESTKEAAAYVPKIVSLGPYHYRNAQFRAMNDHKGKAVHRMKTRFNSKHNNNSSRMDFSSLAKDEILKLEGAIRESYEEKIKCEAESLAMMLCLDGCFILEILRTLGGHQLPGEGTSNRYEPVFERGRIDYTGLDILNDILKLENQVPLIVLRRLLELELNSNDVEVELFTYLVRCPNIKLYPFQYDVVNWQQQADGQVHHLLGLMHSLIVSAPCPPVGEPADQNRPQLQPEEHRQSLLPLSPDGGGRADQNTTRHEVGDRANQTEPNDEDTVRRIPCAAKLRNAGIKFEKCDGGIEKIKFEKGSATIFLPPIYITDHTEVLFRNLIALELCKPSEINYMTRYVSLMDELIDSEEDVGVLEESEVLINCLGSDVDVAKLFNGLCIGVTKNEFMDLKKEVFKHYKSKFKVWSADFATKYFSSPWKSLALIGAIIGLLLTLLQTIYAIIAVYK